MDTAVFVDRRTMKTGRIKPGGGRMVEMNEERTDSNLAAEFYVASQLLRRYRVSLTLGHTKEIDLFVAHPDGRTVTIDVKGLKNTTNWPMPSRPPRAVHFYALVTYRNRFTDLGEPPEVFVIPSREVPRLCTPWSGKPEKMCIGYRRIKDSNYKDGWGLLFGKRKGKK